MKVIIPHPDKYREFIEIDHKESHLEEPKRFGKGTAWFEMAMGFALIAGGLGVLLIGWAALLYVVGRL